MTSWVTTVTMLVTARFAVTLTSPMQTLDRLTSEQYKNVQTLDFTRYVAALAMTKNDTVGACTAFARTWPTSPHAALFERRIKEAVSGASSGVDAAWGDSLVPTELGRAFIGVTQPFTLLGRLQGVRRTPFNVAVSLSTTALGFAWVAQGRAKPLTQGVLDRVVLPPSKAAGIIVVSTELVRFAVPGSMEFLREELRQGLIAFLDAQLVDPAVAAVDGQTPASITNGLSALTAAGSTATDAINDITVLLAAFVAAGGHLESAVVLLSTANAVGLRLTGNLAFAALTREGGQVAGLPALASAALGDQIVVVDASGVFVADDGAIAVSTTQQGSLEMDDAPSSAATGGGTPTGASGTTQVSLFQTDSTGIRIERAINWQARAGAVAVLNGCDYLPAGSPA